MAQITINEISQNYTYNIGNSSYATVALPITSSWGPGCFENTTSDEVVWSRFPATQEGLESFVRTYRSPTAWYKMVKDYSYQIATTLLTAGYDVLTCRLSKGVQAAASTITLTSSDVSSILDNNGQPIYDSSNNTIDGVTATTSTLSIQAKYPGTFGNNLSVTIKFNVLNRKTGFGCWNIIVNAKDSSGYVTAVENLVFFLDVNSNLINENIPHISEIESKFINITTTGVGYDYAGSVTAGVDANGTATLSGGGDFVTSGTAEEKATAISGALTNVKLRYGLADGEEASNPYYAQLSTILNATTTSDRDIFCIAYKQWLYTKAAGPSAGSTKDSFSIYDLLKDKLSYSPNRVISPGWDDQNLDEFGGAYDAQGSLYATIHAIISPIARKLMDVGYYSRCATAYIDEPYSYPVDAIYNTTDFEGYAQLLADTLVLSDPLYPTHSELVGPWKQYTLVGMNKPVMVSPSVIQLLVERAQILNQPIQYEWALPTNRSHTLTIGKANHAVTQTMIDTWQSNSGVGVNLIADIPGLGTTLWGNSTLFNVPPATYQALANLSTRKLFNAIKDLVFRCGIAITFQYNNDAAYSSFYAGVSPLLDTMRNVGAIDDYRIQMAADINGLDQVNANSVIGKIYLVVNGVINDITVDLIAMPAGTDLNQFVR